MDQNKEITSPPRRVELDAMGRIVLPAEIRSRLDLQQGDELLLRESEDGFASPDTAASDPSPALAASFPRCEVFGVGQDADLTSPHVFDSVRSNLDAS